MTLRCLSLSFALFAAAGAALAARTPADATPAGTLPVSVQSGADLRAICPQVDQALQESLAGVWSRHEMPATVQMRMRVSGHRVTDVRASSGYPDYRRAARLAVRRLACDGGATPQVVSFDIAFVAPPKALVKLGR